MGHPDQFELFPKPSRVEKTHNEKIPFSWFEGSGVEEKGLTRFDFSQEFYKKFNTGADKEINEKTLELLHDYEDAKQIDIFEAQDVEYKKKIEDVQNNIKNVTGVSLGELLEEKDYLLHKYWGKSDKELGEGIKYIPDPKPVE